MDVDGNELDPRTLISRLCWVRAAVKIESIYIGANPSIQIKLYEAEIRPLETGVKRLLQRPKAEDDEPASAPATVEKNVVAPTTTEEGEDSQIEDENAEEDTTPAVVVPSPPPPTPVRKVVRKVVSKK